MREPPKITRPSVGERQGPALRRFADEVNAVTAWIHEALQEMERLSDTHVGDVRDDGLPDEGLI